MNETLFSTVKTTTTGNQMQNIPLSGSTLSLRAYGIFLIKKLANPFDVLPEEAQYKQILAGF